MIEKPHFCYACPINDFTEGYVPLKVGLSNVLGVGEAAGENEAREGIPFCGGAGVWLDSLCKASKTVPKNSLSLVNVIGCRPRGNVFPTSSDWKWTDRKTAWEGVNYCRTHHFLPAVSSRPWKKIIALGDHAMYALTGKRRILKWRGSPLPLSGGMTPVVMPTLHPAYLMRQAGMFSVCVKDLQKPMVLPPENYNLFPSLADVRDFRSKRFAFDFEWDREGNITICGLSDRLYSAIVVPFQGEFVEEIRRIFEDAEDIIGQNIIMADWQYVLGMGWKIKARLHDTMLKQHLIQPDYRHGLDFICSVFTNKVFWKGGGKDTTEEEEGEEVTGAQWKTWNDPNGLPKALGGYLGCTNADEAYRLYNARDTDGSFQAEIPINNTLRSFGMERIYWNLSVPAAHECRRMSARGIKIDTTKVEGINKNLAIEIEELEQQLPEGLRPIYVEKFKNTKAPAGLYKSKTIKCKGKRSNGTAHEVLEWTVCETGGTTCATCGTVITPKLTPLKTIKTPVLKKITPWSSAPQIQKYATSVGCREVKNRKTGNLTTGKNARKSWSRQHPEFVLVDQVKKRATLRSNFAKESLLNYDRIYFQLLVHGTSEGRLSCRGLRPGIDPNIQNQPKSIRGIYVPDHSDWGFVEADWSQGENWLTAYIAGDQERLRRLAIPGYDEHSDLASRCFGVEVTKYNENKHLRDPGKVMIHGKNYGMGVEHMQENLALEGFNFSLAEVRAMNEEWKKMNPGTAEWQKRTANEGQAKGFLVNAFGRKRWFSSRRDVNKMLAFLPASTLADMMLRVLIALNPTDYTNEISELGIEMIANLPPQWFLAWTVHDSFILTGPWKYHLEAARQLQAVMHQPWRELDGFNLTCEVKGSQVSWGDLKEIERL